MVSLVRGSPELNQEGEQGQSAAKRRKVEVEVNGEKKIITVQGRERVECSFTECKRSLNAVTQLANGCFCKGKFCNEHKPHEKHSCTFDWNGRAKEILKKKIAAMPGKYGSTNDFSGGGGGCAH